MTDDYYDSAVIELTVRYKIEWRRGSQGARDAALEAATTLPEPGFGGVGPDGCYGVERVPDSTRVVLQDEVERLRAFCRAIMREWPNGMPDGYDIQEAAAASGLLIESTVTEPCGESCYCAEYCDPDEFAEGVTCYKKVDWLVPTKGEGT